MLGGTVPALEARDLMPGRLLPLAQFEIVYVLRESYSQRPRVWGVAFGCT